MLAASNMADIGALAGMHRYFSQSITRLDERFDERGSNLYDVMQIVYRARVVRAKLFSDDGSRPLLHRHAFNMNRDLTQNMKAIKAKLDKKGPMLVMRGIPMGTVADGTISHTDAPRGPGSVELGEQGEVWLFSGATFTQALFELLRENPEHEFLQKMLSEGMDILIWDSHIPQDAIEWLKEEGNNFQDGWEFTWCEMLDKCSAVTSAWEAFKAEGALETTSLSTGSSETAFKVHKRWFDQRYLHEFENITCYNNVKGFFAGLEKLPDSNKLYTEFRAHANAHFTQPKGMKKASVAAGLHDVIQLMTTHFSELEPTFQAIVTAELLKMCYPRVLSEHTDGRRLEPATEKQPEAEVSASVVWVLNKHSRIERLRYLRAPMGGVVPSVLYAPAPSMRKKGSSDSIVSPKPKAKKAKKNHEPDSTMIKKAMPAEELDGTKAKTWLDDLCASLWSMLEPLGGFEKVDRKHIESYVATALNFAIIGEVEFNYSDRAHKTSKLVRQWSRLRRMLRQDFWKANKQHADEMLPEDGGERPFSLMTLDDAFVETEEQAETQQKIEKLQDVFVHRLSDKSFVHAAKKFLKENVAHDTEAGKGIQYYTVFRSVASLVARAFADAPGATHPLCAIMEEVRKAVAKEYTPEFYQVVMIARELTSVSGATFDVRGETGGIFESDLQLRCIWKLRLPLFIGAACSVCCGFSKMLDSGVEAGLQAILEFSQDTSNHRAMVEILELCDAGLGLEPDGHQRLAACIVTLAQTAEQEMKANSGPDASAKAFRQLHDALSAKHSPPAASSLKDGSQEAPTGDESSATAATDAREQLPLPAADTLENRATALKQKFGVSVPTLHRLFQLRLEAYLIEIAQCANTAKVDQVTPDRGLECLIMPSKPGSPFTTRTLHKFLRINIVGNVSPFPQPGSLRLCSAFGLLWYINPPKDTTLATTFGWNPAFAIPIYDKKNKNALESGVEVVVLEAHKVTFPFKFTYPKFLGQAFETFQVILWHYVVPKEYEHSDARQVHVFRERIAESLSKSDAARTVDWPNFAEHGQRKEASRENTAKFLTEWPCKHLFT